LLSKQQAMERSEKAKKQREMKKYGKKVLEAVLRKQLNFTVAIANSLCEMHLLGIMVQ